MKFEELLMQPNCEGRRRRLALQEEVDELQERLDGEVRLNIVLRWAIESPQLLSSCQTLSPPELPLEVQVLLTELEMVEEEIIWLERKLRKLKQSLSLGHHQSADDSSSITISPRLALEQELCFNVNDGTYAPTPSRSSTSIPASLVHLASPCAWIIEPEEIDDPNRISEQLLRSLISIFVKMSKASGLDSGARSGASKHTLSCITTSRRGFPTKSSFTCKARPSIHQETIQTLDPNCNWDVAPYKFKGYSHITRTSFSNGILDCNATIMTRIRVLMQKLCHADLTSLKYKQKLAFWINVYNACIMNAYLQHGLPSTQEKMLSLMNKAVLNVGGIVLNALAIEHYILRHPHDSKQDDVADEKEILLRRAYGLRYPEPNVTFALCRGNWSSPALKVYSSEEVVNELERAKVEYLEASVGVRSKKKILVPKLLRWHIHDFADDLESLIEWIYSQLPQNGLLKRRIMECLNGEMNHIRNMVEIIPYEYEFRYLIPS